MSTTPILKISDLELPEYSFLKDSEFYEGLDFEEEEILQIKYCSRYTENINLYLEVINFWGVRTYPNEFLDLIIKIKPFKEISKFVKMTKCPRFQYLIDLIIAYKKSNIKQMIDYSAYYGVLEGLIFFNNYMKIENEGNSMEKEGDMKKVGNTEKEGYMKKVENTEKEGYMKKEWNNMEKEGYMKKEWNNMEKAGNIENEEEEKEGETKGKEENIENEEENTMENTGNIEKAGNIENEEEEKEEENTEKAGNIEKEEEENTEKEGETKGKEGNTEKEEMFYDENTTNSAAKNGHLIILKYLISNKCKNLVGFF